jgi:hypothetical protein
MPFIKKVAEIAAQYTEEDPFDIEAVKELVDELRTQWFLQDPDTQKRAIANAMRAALTSPRQDLKWNTIVYQNMQNIPPDESNPQVYEDHIRSERDKWNSFGQISLDTAGTVGDQDMQTYAPHMVQRYQPGIWANVRNPANVAPYLDQLRQIALEDVARGGDGNYWRQQVLDLQIPGVGPKVTSFAWLLLNPDTSQLSTLDVHMMRALKQDVESPANIGDYYALEKQLEAYKQSLGPKYADVPLGIFQWAVWDWQRTHGFHQDHAGLRPLNPTPWHQIDWAQTDRFANRMQRSPEVNEQQQSLFSKLRLAWTI